MKLKKLLVLLLLAVAALTLTACGEQGVQGEKGPKGETGDTGAQGDKGQAGDQGEQGDKGNAGADGVAIEFSFTSEGLAWRYKGTSEWTVGVYYDDIWDLMPVDYSVRIAALAPDYLVDTALSEKGAGDTVIAYGKSYVYGTSAFASLADAFAAAKVASASSEYAGLSIFADSGVYSEEVILEAANVTLYGPNANVDPVDDAQNTTKKAAILDGTILVKADGFTINGFQFAGVNNASGFAADDPDSTKGYGKSNLAFEGGFKNHKVLYCDTAEGTDASEGSYKVNKKSYMIVFGGACEDFELGHCNIYPKVTGGDVRPFKNQLGVSKNFYIHDCTFNYAETSDQYDDVVRLDYIDGYFTFEKNEVVGWSNQSYLFLGNKQNTAEITIRGNYFGYTELTEGGHGNGIWIRRAGETISAGNSILVEYNEFGTLAAADPALIIRAGVDVVIPEGKTPTITIQHNVFGCDCQYVDLQGASSSVESPELAAITTLNGNYYKNAENSDLRNGLTDENAKANPADVEKLKVNANKIRDAYTADYLAVNGLSADSYTWEVLDTNGGESSWMVTMLSSTEMNEKWAWLYESIALIADNLDLANPSADNANTIKGYMLANLYGLFTGTQHKDTWLEKDSADWSIEANILSVLEDAPANLK